MGLPTRITQIFIAMLRTVYPAIKAANPDVQVLAGALAPTLAPPGSPDGMNDLAFLQAMYDAGAAPYFDLLAIHAYGWGSDPDECQPLTWSIFGGRNCCMRLWCKTAMVTKRR